MKIYLAADGDTGVSLPVARLGYKVGENGVLTREGSPQRAALMLLWNGNCMGGNPRLLASQVLRELAQRGYKGLVADFEGSRRPFLSDTIAELTAPMRARGLSLFIHESYATVTDYGKVLIPAAVSGGSLKDMLLEKSARYGTARLAIEIERVRKKFPLPSRTGGGEPLTASQLRKLREKYMPACFFSNHLCAYYFTYMDEKGRACFVLFDDPISIRKKIQIADSLGITDAFMVYDEVADILPNILQGLDNI